MDDYIIAGLTVLMVSILVGLVRTFLFGLLGMPGAWTLARECRHDHERENPQYYAALRAHHAAKRARWQERGGWSGLFGHDDG